MAKELFDYTVAEFDTAIGIVEQLAITTTESFMVNLKSKGIADKGTLNSHEHMTHLANTLSLLKKTRDVQAGGG